MSPYYQTLRQALGKSLLLIPGVAAVIHDEKGRLLLQKKHDGTWSLPAGAIEPGESPQEAVLREIAEETGLVCQIERILGVFGGKEFRWVYPHGDEVENVVTLFACKVHEQGTLTDTEETAALAYFSRAEMPALALPYPIDLLFPSS